jgi:hypothetical protein
LSNYDPLDLKAQERGKSDKDMQLRLLREAEESDVKWLMANKRGRRIVWRLLDQAGVFRSTFNTNSMQMAFAEGNRNYGLRLMAMVHALCSEQYPLMIKESMNERTNNDE